VTSRQDPATAFTDLWIVDLERGGATRITDEPLLEWSPVWSPDSRQIAYTALSPGPTFTVTVRDAVSGAKLAEAAHSSFFWPR
jgi:Tol biopolymer transport system component